MVWSKSYHSATSPFTCVKGDDVQTLTGNAAVVEVSAATAKDDQVVKYKVSVVFDGSAYTTETENITVPGTATGESDQPGTPDTPSGDACRWCGKTHSGFWGGLVKFFHSIVYFFAHLFGRR